MKGLQVEDFDDAEKLSVHRKLGGPVEKLELRPDIVQELRKFIGSRTQGRIFVVSVSRVEQVGRAECDFRSSPGKKFELDEHQMEAGHSGYKELFL